MAALKQQYGLRYVYCWHAMAGFWGGLGLADPEMAKYQVGALRCAVLCCAPPYLVLSAYTLLAVIGAVCCTVLGTVRWHPLFRLYILHDNCSPLPAAPGKQFAPTGPRMPPRLGHQSRPV